MTQEKLKLQQSIRRYETVSRQLLSSVLQCIFAQWNLDTILLNGISSKPGLVLSLSSVTETVVSLLLDSTE